MASTPIAPLRLRSPFNGEAWPVPPDATPEFVKALEARGFTRIVPVKVEALEVHTYHGVEHAVGATYDCDDQDVETVEVQGKAKRVAGHGTHKTTELGQRRTTSLDDAAPKK